MLSDHVSKGTDQENQTRVTYFIIKGISDVPELQTPIFLLVLLIYLTTLCGNMTIVLLVCLDPHLHTPMYFFLGNLSFIDMFSTTVTLYHVLTSYITGDHTVSFGACLGQMSCFASLAIDQLTLLTAMSYDRYVAICNPLRYHVMMNCRVCVLLAIVCWLLGFIETIPFLVLLINSCYRSNIINHFFCDSVPLTKITCSEIFLIKVLLFTLALFGIFLIPFLLTFISYGFIITTILRIRTSTGRLKAFNTCSSHLTVVILLYVILICQYIKPSTMESLESNKLFSLFNTAAVPILNPIIYSLKNKDVKSAFRRLMKLSKISA
ncbi:olfactory receptor 8G50-like [Discoglossus pictus]